MCQFVTQRDLLGGLWSLTGVLWRADYSFNYLFLDKSLWKENNPVKWDNVQQKATAKKWSQVSRKFFPRKRFSICILSSILAFCLSFAHQFVPCLSVGISSVLPLKEPFCIHIWCQRHTMVYLELHTLLSISNKMHEGWVRTVIPLVTALTWDSGLHVHTSLHRSSILHLFISYTATKFAWCYPTNIRAVRLMGNMFAWDMFH